MRSVWLLLFCLSNALFGQSSIFNWPVQFSPSVAHTPIDSSARSVHTRTRSEQGLLQSSTQIQLTKVDSARVASQGVEYRLSSDPSLDSRQQFFDLSGSLIKKNKVPFLTTYGVQWNPLLTLNQSGTSGALQGNVSGGLTAGMLLAQTRLKVGAGMCGLVWDSLPIHATTQSLKRMNVQGGGYGTLDILPTQNTLGGFLLDYNGSFFARSTPHARLFSVNGQVLGRTAGRRPTDTIYFYIGDSLVHGNDAFVSEVGEGTIYVNRPSVVNNTISASAAIRRQGVYLLSPALVLSATQLTERYPADSALLRDHRDRSFSVQGTVQTIPGLRYSYRGGYQMQWGEQVWLYTQDITAKNRDSGTAGLYDRKNADWASVSMAMSHQVAAKLENGMGFSLWVSYNRESRDYPFATITAQNNDRIRLRSQLDLILLSKEWLALSAYGQYAKTVISYLKASRSGSNSFDSTYSLGMISMLKPHEQFSVSETLHIEANLSGYRYPKLHTNPIDRPPYSRAAFSSMRVQWSPSGVIQAALDWQERYNDAGKWYGEAYIDSVKKDSLIAVGAVFNYYALERITREHLFQLTGTLQAAEWVELSAGGELTLLDPRVWNGAAYVIETYGTNVRIRPFIRSHVSWSSRRSGRDITLDCRIRPVIENRFEELGNFSVKYWDFLVSAQVHF